MKYWSELTGIATDKFTKTSVGIARNGKRKRKGNYLTHGTLHIRINDVGFFYKIIGWIEGLKESFGGP